MLFDDVIHNQHGYGTHSQKEQEKWIKDLEANEEDPTADRMSALEDF